MENKDEVYQNSTPIRDDKNTSLFIEKGQRLRNAIKSAGISQKHFAKQIPIGEKLLSRIVNGKKNLSVAVAVRCAEILGIDYRYLMCETDYKNEHERKAEWTASQRINARLEGILEICGVHLFDINDEELFLEKFVYGHGYKSVRSRYYSVSEKDLNEFVERVVEHTVAEINWMIARKTRKATQAEVEKIERLRIANPDDPCEVLREVIT